MFENLLFEDNLRGTDYYVGVLYLTKVPREIPLTFKRNTKNFEENSMNHKKRRDKKIYGQQIDRGKKGLVPLPRHKR